MNNTSDTNRLLTHNTCFISSVKTHLFKLLIKRTGSYESFVHESDYTVHVHFSFPKKLAHNTQL